MSTSGRPEDVALTSQIEIEKRQAIDCGCHADEIIGNGGVVVESESPRDYADALVRVIQEHDRMTAGTSAFVESHQWRDTLAPLREAVTRIRRPTLIERIKRRIGGAS